MAELAPVTIDPATLNTVNQDFADLISGLQGEVSDMKALVYELDTYTPRLKSLIAAAAASDSAYQNEAQKFLGANESGRGGEGWVGRIRSFADDRLPVDVQRAQKAQTDTQAAVQDAASKLTAAQADLTAIQAATGKSSTPDILAVITRWQNIETHLNAIAVAASSNDTNRIIELVTKGLAAEKTVAPVHTVPVPTTPGTTTTTITTTKAPPVSYGTILAGLAALAAIGGGIWWYTKYKQKNAGPHSRKTMPAMSAEQTAEPAVAKARPPMFPPTARSPMQAAAQANPRRSAGSARAHARLLPPKH